MTQSSAVVFDPLSDAFAADPYPIYAKMREQPTAHYYASEDTWMLTRMEDVQAVALNKTMLRSTDAFTTEAERKEQQRKLNWHDMPHHERFVQFNMLESEGDMHDRLRKLVFREFTPAMIQKQRDGIQLFVDGLLDSLADRDTFDFVNDFAVHVPGHVIGKVLGVPDEDCPQLRMWSEDVVSFFNVGRDEAGKQRAEQSTKEFYHYLLSLLAQRAKSPKEDLLTRLLHQKDAGQLEEDELIATCMLILMAGHGSTIDVLGSGLHALLKFPDQDQKLRNDPSLMKAAVQEMFRYEAPLPYFHRFVTEETVVGGQTFEPGVRLGLLYGAANRDPARFDNPDDFVADRNPNRHIAFGGGTHFCLGNHLARLDMEVIFTALHKRFSRIELAGATPAYKRGLSVRGPQALNVSVTAA